MPASRLVTPCFSAFSSDTALPSKKLLIDFFSKIITLVHKCPGPGRPVATRRCAYVDDQLNRGHRIGTLLLASAALLSLRSAAILLSDNSKIQRLNFDSFYAKIISRRPAAA